MPQLEQGSEGLTIKNTQAAENTAVKLHNLRIDPENKLVFEIQNWRAVNFNGNTAAWKSLLHYVSVLANGPKPAAGLENAFVGKGKKVISAEELNNMVGLPIVQTSGSNGERTYELNAQVEFKEFFPEELPAIMRLASSVEESRPGKPPVETVVFDGKIAREGIASSQSEGLGGDKKGDVEQTNREKCPIAYVDMVHNAVSIDKKAVIFYEKDIGWQVFKFWSGHLNEDVNHNIIYKEEERAGATTVGTLISVSRLRHLFDDALITRSGQRESSSYRLNVGEVVHKQFALAELENFKICSPRRREIREKLGLAVKKPVQEKPPQAEADSTAETKNSSVVYVDKIHNTIFFDEQGLIFPSDSTIWSVINHFISNPNKKIRTAEIRDLEKKAGSNTSYQTVALPRLKDIFKKALIRSSWKTTESSWCLRANVVEREFTKAELREFEIIASRKRQKEVRKELGLSLVKKTKKSNKEKSKKISVREHVLIDFKKGNEVKKDSDKNDVENKLKSKENLETVGKYTLTPEEIHLLAHICLLDSSVFKLWNTGIRIENHKEQIKVLMDNLGSGSRLSDWLNDKVLASLREKFGGVKADRLTFVRHNIRTAKPLMALFIGENSFKAWQLVNREFIPQSLDDIKVLRVRRGA